MANLKELKTRIENVNEKGKAFLGELHCIELDETATTYDIVNCISNIPPLQYAKNLSNFMRIAQIPENTEYTLYLPKCENLEEFMFNVKNIKKIRFTALNEYGGIFLKKCFLSCPNLEEICFDLGVEDGFEYAYVLCDSFNGFVSNCGKLKRVEAVFDVYDVAEDSISLIGCKELEEILFAEYSIAKNLSVKDSPKLSAKSVESIVEGLVDAEEPRTLTLNSAITLSDEQKARINSRGWSLVFYEK